MARQSAIDCATVAQAAFGDLGSTVVTTMVAIAGGESGWNPAVGGDSPRILRNIGYTQTADGIIARRTGCPPGSEDGYVSWGLWQINQDAHMTMLTQFSGLPSSDPCAIAAWLKIPANNARAARAVYDSSGYGAWTIYNTGAYQQYMSEAADAVATVTAPVVTPPAPDVQPLPMNLAVTLTVLGIAGVVLYLLLQPQRGV